MAASRFFDDLSHPTTLNQVDMTRYCHMPCEEILDRVSCEPQWDAGKHIPQNNCAIPLKRSPTTLLYI